MFDYLTRAFLRRPDAAIPFRLIGSSISFRLLAIVLLTATICLAIIASLTATRLADGLEEQAVALRKLSEQQVSDRLFGDAQLAGARLQALGAETARRLRQTAQRPDVLGAISSGNDVAIREVLGRVGRTAGFDSIVVFDTKNRVIGASSTTELIGIDDAVAKSAVLVNLRAVLAENAPNEPHGREDLRPIEATLASVLKLAGPVTVAHEAVEPLFDEFGETIGALVGYRVLTKTEHTLDNFSSLANAGVLIILNGEVVSAAGPAGVAFPKFFETLNNLTKSLDDKHVARCVSYSSELKVCSFTDAAAVTAIQHQMFRIGAKQMRSLMTQFLFGAGLSLLALVGVLLVSVRYLTRGLSELGSAVSAVANGNVDLPFRALGTGEVHRLALAFERMLVHLRASIGRIQQLAFSDTVTGLLNREKLSIDADALLGASDESAVFFIDLDGFKSINDTFGHRHGDVLLKQVAERLTTLFRSKLRPRSQFALARMGGDEFVAVIPEVSRREADLIAREALAAMREPFIIGTTRLTIGLSIGVSLSPADGTTYEVLLSNADLAMYAAKRKSRNTYAFFETKLADSAHDRVALENDLKTALREARLEVHYQPKISCKTTGICGAEALIRWHHPTRGWVSPAQIIEIAEEAGLIGEIGNYVLVRALDDFRTIALTRKMSLAVNISPFQLEDIRFPGRVMELMEAYNFPADRLELEITETCAMREIAVAREAIHELRKRGIRFAIDDFGAGYSNLSSMARLPFDTVKLDSSLIRHAGAERESQTLVKIALSMARELQFETVVEGVETAEQYDFVSQHGADLVQGFLFSPAVPIDNFRALIEPSKLMRLIPRNGIAPVRANRAAS